VTWPPPDPDAGVDDGELRPLDEEEPDELDEPDDEELPDELDLFVLPGDPEPAEPAADVAWCVPPADEADAACDAPGSVNATAPAAIRLAAAAVTVTERSRCRPRSRAATAAEALCCWWFMAASFPTRFPQLLYVASQSAMSACPGV
jgi:hypothetical protein